MNIYILSNREIVKNEVAGNNGENNAEIMQFYFPEQIVGIDMSKITKWIQFHNDSLDLLQMIENDKYSLTDLITQYESVEYQVLLKYNNLVLWKSNIDELDFGESLDIDVTITLDDLSVLNQLRLQVVELKKQYEEAIKKGNDNIKNLIKQVEDLEDKIKTAEALRKTAEQDRVTAENARVQAETERNQKLADLVKEVEDTISKLAHSIDEYNSNAEKQLKRLNDTADIGVSAVISAKNSAISDMQSEKNSSIKAINDETTKKIEEIDTHVSTKTTEFDTNATNKTNTFNSNVTSKTTEFNANATEKVEDYNQNATSKTDDFNNNFEDKMSQINSELNVERITKLEEKNTYQNQVIKGLNKDKETATEEGSNITITDCAEAPVESVICGSGIYQATETENLIDNEWENGVYNNSGNFVVSSSSICSKNFQRVYPNHLYKISRTIAVDYMNFRFYDKDYNFLGNQSVNGMIISNISNNQMVAGVFSIEITITNAEVAYMTINDTSNDLSTIYTMITEAINIDYPSPVEYVEGNNYIEHVNENLINVKNLYLNYPYQNVTYNDIKYENGIFIEYGKTERIIHFRTPGMIKANKIYYLKCNYEVLEGNKTTKLTAGFLQNNQYFNVNTSVTAKTDNNTVSLYVNQASWVEGLKIAITDIMLCEVINNKIPDTYVEHKSEIYLLDLTNRNLLSYPYEQTSKSLNGIVWTDNGDGSISAKGTATDNSSFALYGKNSDQKIINGMYLSGGINSNSFVRAITKQSDGYVVLGVSNGNVAKINLDTYQEGYIEIYIKAGTEVDTTFYPMLTNFETDVYVPYTEPYQYNLYSPEDKIVYLKDGAEGEGWYVCNTIIKEKIKISDGVIENSVINNENYKVFRSNFYVKKEIVNAYPKIYSNFFNSASSYDEIVRNSNVMGINDVGQMLCCINNETTWQEYVDFFDNNDCYIIYPLRTPIYTKITDTVLIEQLNKLRKMISYEGINYIIVTSSNSLPITLKIEYTKSSKVIISRLEDRVAKLEQAVFPSETTTVQEIEETPIEQDEVIESENPEDEWEL